MRYFLFGMSGLLLLMAGGVFAFNWSRLPPQLPWLFSLPWGEGQLIPKLWFGLGLVFLLMVIVINFLIAKRMKKIDGVIARVVEGATLLLVTIYLASFFKVILIMI